MMKDLRTINKTLTPFELRQISQKPQVSMKRFMRFKNEEERKVVGLLRDKIV
jgi:hypothetical protein